jgi:hypothetical protein
MFLIAIYHLDVDVLCKGAENYFANLWKVLTASSLSVLSKPAEVLDGKGIRR